MVNVHGEPLAAESLRMIAYLKERAAALDPPAVRARVRAAMNEMDGALAGLDAADARTRPIAGEWTVAQVVDHLAQTQIRAADELRHLLAGRRPPAPPVYDALGSGAAEWAPWAELLDGLRGANEEMDAQLALTAGDGADARARSQATVRTVLLANRKGPDGVVSPETFLVDLDWKEYALVQRLHLLDHRTQVKKLRAALADRTTAAT